MANLFDQFIHDIREANGGEDNDIVRELLAKQAELGEDVPDEVVLSTVKAVLERHLAAMTDGESSERSDSDESEEDAIVISADDREYMTAASAVVKDFLDSNNWHYSVRSRRPDLVTYELGFSIEGCNIKARVHVEADPRVCRIDAVLPLSADPTFEYPLCVKIAEFNYGKRFGTMKYDSRDGELMYSYSFLTNHGIHPSDLDRLFHTIVDTGVDGFEEIRRCAVGRFSRKDADEILEKVNALVTDLSE